jgi:hypothetical protein
MLHRFCKDKASITVAMVTTFSRFHTCTTSCWGICWTAFSYHYYLWIFWSPNIYFLKLHRTTLTKYHAIKTMKAYENGQILRGPPPRFSSKFNILAYIKYSFHTISLRLSHTQFRKTIGFLHSTLNICSHFQTFNQCILV